jgi:hypothetical protein
MESSIWVATITGLPNLRQRAIMRFCSMGTRSLESSTARSPLATMIPSEAWMISSMLSMASCFSILETTGALPPNSLMRSLTSRTSSPVRTNEVATQSGWSSSRPKRKSSMSLGVRPCIERWESGKFRPLCEETGPPSRTSQIMSPSSTLSTLSPMRPSSMRSRSPGFTSSASRS